jgi:hypothetical protein
VTNSYGEIGYEIMSVALRFMFPDGMDLTHVKPLTYAVLLNEVLLPEAAQHIVQEDLDLMPLAAKNTLRASHIFGVVQHPSSSESLALAEAIRKTTEITRRAMSKYRSWLAADTNLDIDK